jgi:hypothetical protein
VVPIYRTESKGLIRFTVSFYWEGRRMRKMFNDLNAAKKEALFVAQRIQSDVGTAARSHHPVNRTRRPLSQGACHGIFAKGMVSAVNAC